MTHDILCVGYYIIIYINQTSPRLRPVLSKPDLEKLFNSLVTSRLDYCDAFLGGLPSKSTPILASLHWLPIQFRINFKTLNAFGPQYLSELLSPKQSSHSLLSNDQRLLAVPKTHFKTMSDRAFCCLGPRLWNELPPI
ncbi:unnamed protein product [Coregonus sp. 'balchen']|nr:unnamed protein product [Coregonus sp. 'balchen']